MLSMYTTCGAKFRLKAGLIPIVGSHDSIAAGVFVQTALLSVPLKRVSPFCHASGREVTLCALFFQVAQAR